MKPVSRFLSFMLAVLTLFTALPALALPAAAEDYPTLLPGDAIYISDETEFQFTPTESGTYRFYSTDNNGDPRGYLYDAGHKLITYDDDGNGNRNFKIEYDLTAGETYYLSASFWNGGSGSYTVCLEFIGIAGDGWSLVDGVLTISADFVMDDYSWGSAPWYSYRNDIVSVVLEDGVTTIGDYAFSSCTSLTSVTIPNSVTSIGEYAFYRCSALTSVTIPDSVTRIYWYAFYDCSSLTDIYCEATEQPASWVGDWLCGCDATVHWGEKSVSAGECGENLTYTLNSNGRLQIDGTGAMTNWSSSSSAPWYSNRDKIKTVVIGSGVTSIGDYAFPSCTSLTSVTIPSSVTAIGSYAFGNCSSLTSVTLGNSVTSIGEYAFEWCDSLTSVTIPDSVTSIGDFAFYYCSSLTSVTLGNSVTGIGDYAFNSCTSLTAITVAEGNPSYCSIDGILYSADKTELICCPEGKAGSVTIPDSVTSIGYCAFYCCRSLTSVTIPDSVTGIGWDAFRSCSSLTSVTIPDSVTSIGEHAFAYCFSLTSVTIGNSVTSIGYGAFYSCSVLTSVTIPDSVTYLDWYAFAYCRSLTSVTIGNSVTSIGYRAFFDCSSLTSVHISDIGAWCGVEFSNSDSNPLFYAHNLYLNGKLVTDLVIPGSVTSIGDYAFFYCTSLTSVTIPDSVTSIGDYAFFCCSNLTDIYCEASSQPTGWSSDWNYDCSATVHWGSTGPDEPELVTGDLNEDGTLSILDVTKLLIWIKEASVTPERLTMGDLNEDGTLSILDVTALLRMLSEQ